VVRDQNIHGVSRVTRDCELVERLRHVVHERVPLARRDAQVPVRALHVLAGVFLRTSGAPAQHLGNQVFETCRRYLVVRVVDQGIGVEPGIGHHAVDEVVYDGRDAVDTAEPLVKAGRILRGHWHLLLLPHAGKVDSMARFWSSLASSYGGTPRRMTSRAPSASLDADGPICGLRCRLGATNGRGAELLAQAT
jgi:hypothetical protein